MTKGGASPSLSWGVGLAVQRPQHVDDALAIHPWLRLAQLAQEEARDVVEIAALDRHGADGLALGHDLHEHLAVLLPLADDLEALVVPRAVVGTGELAAGADQYGRHMGEF